MSATPPMHDHRRESPAENREAHLGLRMRLWLACLSGGTIAGLGSLWVLGTRVRPGATDPAELLAWLSGVAFLSLFAGLFFALWLDHHVVGHLRGLLRGLGRERVAELRGLPAAHGWGELSQLTSAVTEIIGEQRRASRAAHELELLRAQLAALREAVERWAREERWSAPAVPAGPVEDVSEPLARGLARRAAVDEQNREVAVQVARELAAALADAHESAAQAERGFVEATAMLTTVRELQRLSGELQGALDQLASAPATAVAGPAAPAVTREVLEDLVAASHASVESLGRGMLRVQDVAEQVQQMANRATLIAIHAVSAVRPRDGREDDLADELKRLARDVREMTDRTAQFAHEVETAVADAAASMREARERALARLEAPEPAPAASAPADGGRALDDAQRLLERVREMVQDAARKGERLSQSGERASRAAERLARRIDDEAAESEALAVRLAPPDAPPVVAAAPALRLLDDEPEAAADAAAADEPPAAPGEERS